MKPRILSDSPLLPDSQTELTGSAAAHVGKVLRLRAGDPIVLFDGAGLEFDARIESITRQSVIVSVGDGHDPGTESRLAVTLLQGICRSHRMDMLIQKATELGVVSIHPVSCERSVARLDGDRGRRKIEHWRQVAISACEQSGRVRIPAIVAPATLTTAIEAVTGATGARLLLDPLANENIGAALDSERRVALLIGPEGGLTTSERAAARAGGFQPVRLGPRTLRTETAPLAALSIVQYLAGDLS